MIRKIPQDSSAPAPEVEDVLKGVQILPNRRKRSPQIAGGILTDTYEAVTIQLTVNAIAKQWWREEENAPPPLVETTGP